MTIKHLLVQTIPNRKHVRQMFACPDCAVGFIQTHFVSLTSFMGIPESVRILCMTFLFNNLKYAIIIQIHSVIKLYMFRASSLPIIRNFLLYIRHW